MQYACEDYVRMLRDHAMIPSMSRPAHPHDNASCESFMKTLKREEIYANEYRDFVHPKSSSGNPKTETSKLPWQQRP